MHFRELMRLRYGQALTLGMIAAGLCAWFRPQAQGQGVPPANAAPAQAPVSQAPRTPKPGVPGIRHDIAELQRQSTVYPVEGSPDWSVITPEATWVASARANHVVELLPSGKAGFVVDIHRPCAGLTAGFGSIWSPSCADKKLMRIDSASGHVVASVDADPENSEGGITTGAGSVWMVVKPSTLIRIDPAANKIVASVRLPGTAANPVFDAGFVWVSTFEGNSVVQVDPKTNTVIANVPTGPKPRFITFGDGSVWTLNQGDGTVTRIDAATAKVVATIHCGLPGEGGDLSFGDGYVWAALFEFPLTQIDPKTNQPVRQWAGPGGDGMRAGGGSVWLSNLRQQTVWRIRLPIAR